MRTANVLRAVNLDNEKLLSAKEISIVGTNRELANELETAKPGSLQFIPKHGFGHVVAVA